MDFGRQRYGFFSLPQIFRVFLWYCRHLLHAVCFCLPDRKTRSRPRPDEFLFFFDCVMKILLAGEDRLHVSVLRTLMSDMKVQCDVAPTRSAFARMAATGAYGIIVSLFTEPFLDGSDLAHTIPERSIGSPAIFVLSWSQCESCVMSLYESGVDQFFSLPCDMNRFRGRLARYLNRFGP